MNDNVLVASDASIVSYRGKKNRLNGLQPYGWLTEKEYQPSGSAEDVAVIFLTNNECPFRCLMCDLWKNTLDQPVLPGQIPAQIEWALKQLPVVKHIKLYNSGSFFDTRAIPPHDYEKISSLLEGFETVIVESHPKFIGKLCLRFKDMLKPELQVAIGLETVNNKVLQKLNKKMTTEDFSRSVRFLLEHDIKPRAFILLKPPFQDENEGIFWAERSIVFAFGCGVECCTVIPVRGGNGTMEVLSDRGLFSPPKISSLEKVMEYGLSLKRGRVFADLWNLRQFSECNACFEKRNSRLNAMNLYQKIVDHETCICDDP
jgi:hypothetical protein